MPLPVHEQPLRELMSADFVSVPSGLFAFGTSADTVPVVTVLQEAGRFLYWAAATVDAVSPPPDAEAVLLPLLPPEPPEPEEQAVASRAGTAAQASSPARRRGVMRRRRSMGPVLEVLRSARLAGGRCGPPP